MVPFVQELASSGIYMVEKGWFRQWDCRCGVVMNPECIESKELSVRQDGM